MEQDDRSAQRSSQRRRPSGQPAGSTGRRAAGSRPSGHPSASHTAAGRQVQGRPARPTRGGRPQGRHAAPNVRHAQAQPRAHAANQHDGRRPQSRTHGYNGHNPNSHGQVRARKKKSFPVVIPIAIIAVLILGGMGWLLFGLLSRFDVTVNGETVTLGRGATVQTLLDKEIVSPKPGNLMAVDGSLLSKGDGAPCTAVIDGKKGDVTTPLAAGNVIEITDGEDTTEEADVKETAIKHGESEGDRTFEAYWFGSIHLLSDGEDGVQTERTGKQSGKTVSEVTKEPIDAGYRIYTAKPDDKVIALTFDDGPWPDTTDEILDILEENGAKATFFTIGEQIDGYEEEVRRAVDMGCKVYTHTWDHAAGSGGGTSIANMSADEQVTEIKKGYQAIKDATGEEPDHIMRAPGGNFFGDVIGNVWDIVDAEIGWDVDTEDWSRPGADAIESAILSVQPGQVILMHDGGGDRTQTVEALRSALPQLVEDGFKFVTVDELIAYGMPSRTSEIPTTKSIDEDETSDSETDSESDAESDAIVLDEETEEESYDA